MEAVNIVSTDETYVKKFRLYGSKTTFRFNPPAEGVNELDWLRLGFNKVVEQMKAEASPSDQLGFTLTSLNFKNKEPGYVAFRPVSEVNGDLVWGIFGGIVQSNTESITSSDTFRIECTRVNLPVGSGTNRRPGLYTTFAEECKARKGITVIKNNDNLCLPRALVVGKAHAKKDKEYKLICDGRIKRQTVKANKLVAKARVEMPEGGAGVPELEKFQAHLKKYNITVYNYNTKGRDVYYSGNNETARLKINLLFHDGHYNVITSLTAAFACQFYCEACHRAFDHKGVHRCENICSACNTISPPCKLVHEGIVCPQCNRHFKNQMCFTAHQGTVCKKIKKCLDCGKIVANRTKSNKHVCGEIYCTTCTGFMPPDHQCHMRADRRKPPSKDFCFIFFDLETRQDESHQNDANTKVHKVNLCVSQQFCWECMKVDGEDACTTCGTHTRVFDANPVEQFMQYVMDVRKQFAKVCVIAHNGQGYDFQFLLKYILEETKFTPELITRGTKIILMEVDRVKFIDSLSYFPMPLAALPKSFDLPPEKKKGYFPHLFNTLANQTYVGPMPAKHYYSPDTMFDQSHKAFEEWYNEQINNNYVFDFKKELLEYCMSDVDILAQACMRFRSLLLEQCDVDPFLESVTLASACNLAFRRNFLRPNTIGLIPKRGYRLVDNQSAAALQWLTWEEQQRGIRIRHAGREREVKIDGMKVDGFDEQRVYEFQGCYYHGCPKCFPYKREEPLKEDPSDSLHLRHERTKAKMEKLRKTQYEIVEMWECDFNILKRKNKLKHLESIPLLATLPLNPREAFFGGRTGNAKSYHKCAEGETIQYVDVCSLYPYVCKYGKYPVGHPTIHVGDEECRIKGMDVDGLLKCKIVPPSDLYHPVLPTRMNDKLMFVLCRTCGLDLNPSECTHNEEERSLTGTWTMDEIRKAVQKGYKILEMFEMWEYQVEQIDENKEGGLFTEFINKFLKIKQEASGYPAWCVTEADKAKYVADYLEKEGVKLEPDNIAKNEGLRSLAKLMLNGFWGKLAQRENQTKTMIVREPSLFYKLLSNPSVEVSRVQVINEEVLLVNWKNIEEVGESLRTVNVVLAAYTTAQARLKLYEHLEALGVQVIYYDTDSVVYLFKDKLYRVATGDYLGEMVDELAKEYGPGSYIIEFVSGGPKTYAYIAWSTKKNRIVSVCKVKGLTLNLRTSARLNFETLKQMVLKECEPRLEITENRIRRTQDKEVVTVTEKKIFRVTGAKRKREGDFDTLPYGYKKQKQD